MHFYCTWVLPHHRLNFFYCGCPKSLPDTTILNNGWNGTNAWPQLRVKHYFNEGFRKMHFYCTWVVPHHRLNFFCCGCPKSLPDTTILNNERNGTNAWPQLRVKNDFNEGLSKNAFLLYLGGAAPSFELWTRWGLATVSNCVIIATIMRAATCKCIIIAIMW